MSLNSPVESPCARGEISSTEHPRAANSSARLRHASRPAPMPGIRRTAGASAAPAMNQAPISWPSEVVSRWGWNTPQATAGTGSGNGGRAAV